MQNHQKIDIFFENYQKLNYIFFYILCTISQFSSVNARLMYPCYIMILTSNIFMKIHISYTLRNEIWALICTINRIY